MSIYLAISDHLVIMIFIVIVATVHLLKDIRARVIRVATERSLSTSRRFPRVSPAVHLAVLDRFFILRFVDTTHSLIHTTCNGSWIDDPRLHVTAAVQLSDKFKVYFSHVFRTRSNISTFHFTTIPTSDCTLMHSASGSGLMTVISRSQIGNISKLGVG